MSILRGGVVTLHVLDAGGTPVTLDVEDTLPLGVSDQRGGHYRYEATLHRLTAARFAECGSLITEETTAAIIDEQMWTVFDLCWYCFPRS